MQNWNQWQLSAGAVATSMPQPPVGYATAGADPMAMMQAYMQYYNQPAPSGYTAEQWAAAQQQNWAQWQQWQQQYQQWQAQYGEKYQETMKQMSAQHMNLASQVPQLPIVQAPPPLPQEDIKPPLPPTTTNTYQFTSMPPPHQNNLPLFPVKQNSSSAIHQANVQNCPQNPPLPPNQPPLPPENSNSNKESNSLTGKRSSSTVSESNSAKKLKVEDEELTEAEKTFDAQFKQWEEQFNKWKQQNANHPDKTQYKQYEAKWTSWREKLIERREQMRRKREQQKQATTRAEVEKGKGLPGDDKIMNILSSTENQGLINNLLGIGKTLGLTGKQNTNVPPPPPPPPATETSSSSNIQTTTMTSSSQASSASQVPIVNMMSSNMMSSSSWNSQQWAQQYNAGVNVPNYANFPSMTGVQPPPFGTQTQMPPPNFTQPPPNFTTAPNFSQPPPGFAGNDSRQKHNARPSVPPNVQGRPLPFGPGTDNAPDGNLLRSERSNQTGSMNSLDTMGYPNNFGMTDLSRQKEGVLPGRYGRDGINNQQGNQFRINDMFGQRNDERGNEGDQFRRDDRIFHEPGGNQFSPQKLNFHNDRFNSGNDRFGPGNSRFGPGNDRFGMANDRFGPGDNRFGPGGERIGQGNEPGNDRFGASNELYGPGTDRFNRSNMDRFDQKDTGESRRDSFSNNARGFHRNSQFDPPDKFAPELKKLMEKRRAAIDVFKPSYLDSEKSINVGSLSESFKRITGDSPFMKSGGNNNFGPRGPPNFGPVGPGNFRMSGDFKHPGSHEFGPRCSTGIGRSSTFDSRDGTAGPFRGSNCSPLQVPDLLHSENRQQDMINLGSEANSKCENPKESVITEQAGASIPKSGEQGIDSAKSDTSVEKPDMMEKPAWIGVPRSQDGSLKKDDAEKQENASANYNPTEKEARNTADEGVNAKKESSNTEDVDKKADVLPFMGENDPKPEDLNMEPPPELPNLGPVSANSNEARSPISRADEPYDVKESSVKPFPNNSESFDPRGTFNSTFGPRGMQFRPNAPFLGPRGPNDSRFPMFQPRGPNAFPFNSPGPNQYPFGPRGPNDGPFGPRGSNNGQFGPRGPHDGQFEPRGPSAAHFGPRGPNDGPFGARGPGDFASRGPSDGPFGPRGPTDNQFGVRGPNNGQFGPRASSMGQFGPRFDTPLGLKRPGEGQFGPRGSVDGQFGSQGPSVRPFGPGRPGGSPFDNRGPCDPQFPSRGPNDDQPRFPGPNDRLFGSRRGDLCYQRSPSGSKGTSEGPNRFNEKPLDNSTDFGPQGASDSYYGSRGLMTGPNDKPCDNRQFDVRGIGDFRGKGSDNTSGPKLQGNSEMDPNVQQGPGNPNETQSSGWRQSYGKSNFGDVDRSGRDLNYADKSLPSEAFNPGEINNPEGRSPSVGNKSNMLDKRTDKSMADLTVGDYKSGYTGMYMKRSDNRQSQVRCSTVKEFCIEKQFNYNHAGAGGENKFVEHIPAKVIDYSHTSRSPMQNHLTPVQCFDYGHGSLKPTVPEHEVYPKTDFKNWEENEQNLKEYTEKIRRYEYYAGRKESRRAREYSPRRGKEEIREDRSDRKSERERREKDDYKLKDLEDRIFDHMAGKDQDRRYEKNINKERTWERNESSQKGTNKESNKDEDRSKGNVNWQESSNKNVIDTKPQDSSVADSSQHVLEAPQKTLELAKTPNCTMVDDLLCPPGRQNRPPKIAVILRGPPGSGKSFVAKLIKDKEVEQGGSAPRILSLDDYFLVEKEIESTDDNGKKVIVKEMVYEYEEAMEPSYVTSLVKAFKKNITDGFFNFIILDCINEKISDYEEMWSFAKTKGFKVYVCEMEMDLQICLKRNVHNRTEEEINRIIDYFEPTPSYHQKLDVNSMLQDQAIEEVHMEDTEETREKSPQQNEDSQDSQDDASEIGVSKWERMEAEDKLDRLDGLAKKKSEGKVQTMKDFLQVPDYYNMEDTSGKKRVRWADLEERKEQEKMRAVGFVVGHTNWDRMMDPTKGGSALTRTKFFSLS